MRNENGFLLVEALIALLILSLALTAGLGGIAQALRVAEKSEENTKAILQFENLFYELESSERSDLVYYGGKGKLDSGYQFQVRSEEESPILAKSDDTRSVPNKEEADFISFFHLKSDLFWKGNKEFISLETFFGGREQ